MKTQALSKTNPFLKNAAQRQKLNERAVRSSCAVEGIKVTTVTTTTPIKRRDKKLFKKLKARLGK